MKLPRKFLILVSLSVLAVFLSACSLAEDITPPPGYQEPTQAPTLSVDITYPVSQPNLSDGAAIYSTKCAACHGTTGQGDGPSANQMGNTVAAIGSAGLARLSQPADWYAIITNGRMDRMMPGFSGSLNDQQRWDVLAYVYSLSEPKDALAQGQALYAQTCATCHGADGSAVPTANLADATLQAQLTGANLFDAISKGVAPDMPAYANQLSEDQRWALVSYTRSLANLHGTELLASAVTPQPTGQVTGAPIAQTTPPPGATPQSTATVIGTITGKISNGSGGVVPTGMQVTLHGYDNMNETLTLITTAAADGSFSFSNVEIPSGRVFMASVTYKDTTFNSQIAHPQANTSNAINLPLTIYETTTDTSKITIDRMHVFFDFSQSGTVQVVELYIISNTGNQTIVSSGASKPVLTFVLPQGFTNLQFEQGQMGQRYVSTENGFGDTQSIPPGSQSTQLLFAFNLPYSKKLDITLPVTRPVSAVVVMVPKGGISAQSDMLTDGGEQDVQGMTFHLYNAENIAPDKPLTLTLSGNPTSAAPALSTGGSFTTLIIGLAALALALIGGGLWLYRQRSLAAAEGISVTPESSAASDEDPDAIIDAIVALDDMYQSGNLPEAAYRERRANLKARLADTLAKE